jgi:4-amino-4-deoxychorismate lyase
MMRLIETIKIKDQKALHLSYHNKRLNYSRRVLFNAKDEIDLKSYIPEIPDENLYKLRVIYSREIEKIELLPYKISTPKSFRVVEFSGDYSFKYLDRDEINQLKRENFDVDEIILSKSGKITDTSIANIALFIDGEWISPKKPLLKGTTRERYLRDGLLKLEDLSVDDLTRAKALATLNVMVDFLIIENFEIKG